MAALIEITNDEQAKEIFQSIKKYFESKYPQEKYFMSHHPYDENFKKNASEREKNRYNNDPEYKAHKLAYAKIQNEKRKEERKKKRDEKKLLNKKSDSDI